LGDEGLSLSGKHTTINEECAQLKGNAQPFTRAKEKCPLFTNLKMKFFSDESSLITMPIPANEKPEWLLQSHG
jgi:hypothetical protein